MVKYQPQLDMVFQSLADPIRRDIIRRVARRAMTVNALATPYHVSLPAISKHLKVLERASLITRKKVGREYMIALNPAPLKTVARYLAFYKKLWNRQFDNLEHYLATTGPPALKTTARRKEVNKQ